MSVNSKMTAIADQIRTLQGGTGKLGLDAMAQNVEAANNEVFAQAALIAEVQDTVTAQASLISQIATALEGKVGGGGGELKSATGTATGGGDTTFTVTGLTFTPSILIVTAPVDDSYSGVESAIGTTDFVYAVGYYTQSINTKLAWGSAGTLSPANGGCALSLTSVTNSNLNFKTAVTYTWYAYGL